MKLKTKETSIKGIKGFNQNFKCRDFQYEIGQNYETPEEPVRCTSSGFHFCENPLDVFNYYPPSDSKYAEVTGSGKVSRDISDSKIAVSKIKIDIEIGLKDIIERGIKFIFKQVKFAKGNSVTEYQAGSQATGDRAGSQATGDQAGSQATGDRAMSSVNGFESSSSVIGENSIACGLGISNKAKASLNSWIVLAERSNESEILTVKSTKIDGKKLLPDTFYMLKNGKFIKA